MRRFAISDIHGSYHEMMALFEYATFSPTEDQLVVIGDMIDRGPHSGLVLKELRNLEQTYENVHVTDGNHEEMMIWYLDNKSPMWSMYGGIEASKQINETFKEEGTSSIIEWVRTLPLFYEDEKFVYAHAGIDKTYGKKKQNRDILWMKEEIFYGLDDKKLLTYTKNKSVIHGHTPTNSLVFDGVRLNIDLGAQVETNSKLALVELEEMMGYVYDFSTKKIEKQSIKRK